MSQTILITGGTRGIGRGIANILASQGHSVVVTSRTRKFDPGLSIEAGETVCQNLDVSHEESSLRLFAWLDGCSTAPDVLINNAGIGKFAPFLKLTSEDLRQIIEVNLIGAFRCSHAAVERMVRKGGGRIVNIGSIVDKVALPGNTVYGTSKWALRGFGRTLAEEMKEQSIRVTHVSLGAVYTEIWEGREGFSAVDMLAVEDVSRSIAHIALLPLGVRLDECEITPGKGTL